MAETRFEYTWKYWRLNETPVGLDSVAVNPLNSSLGQPDSWLTRAGQIGFEIVVDWEKNHRKAHRAELQKVWEKWSQQHQPLASDPYTQHTITTLTLSQLDGLAVPYPPDPVCS
jgi:hypothetical protein